MKKVWVVIGVIGAAAFLTGLSPVAQGIAERGWSGVNYGRIIFPLLICGVSLWMYRKGNA